MLYEISSRFEKDIMSKIKGVKNTPLKIRADFMKNEHQKNIATYDFIFIKNYVPFHITIVR